MFKCSQCSAEFKANSGLSSHMRLTHGMKRDGTPIPPERLKAIREKQVKGQRSLEAKTKRIETFKAKKKKTPQGPPYTCPECSKYRHRKVEFATPRELGKHRRFSHGVQGQSATALKSRQLTIENRIKAGELETTTAPAIETPAETTFQCSKCPRQFETAKGLGRHMAAHKDEPTHATLEGKEITLNGNGSYGKAGIIHQPGQQPAPRNGKDIADETAQALIVAYATGQLKSLCTAIADQHDIPARFLTVRCAQSLLSEAKR